MSEWTFEHGPTIECVRFWSQLLNTPKTLDRREQFEQTEGVGGDGLRPKSTPRRNVPRKSEHVQK